MIGTEGRSCIVMIMAIIEKLYFNCNVDICPSSHQLARKEGGVKVLRVYRNRDISDYKVDIIIIIHFHFIL